MRIVLLGPPGSGKGTQATILRERLGLAHISTGVLLRDAVGRGTELGRKAQGFMDAGELVPDELVLDLLEERLGQDDVDAGFILDGYPRNLAQAEALEQVLARIGQPVDIAVSVTIGVCWTPSARPERARPRASPEHQDRLQFTPVSECGGLRLPGLLISL